MKINIKKSVIVVVAGAAIFTFGHISGASSSWVNDLITGANKDIGKAAFDKKEEIVTKIKSGTGDLMIEKAAPEIDKKEVEAQNELEQYYQEKLNSLTQTDEYKSAIGQLDGLKDGIVDRYKREIDSTFDDLN